MSGRFDYWFRWFFRGVWKNFKIVCVNERVPSHVVWGVEVGTAVPETQRLVRALPGQAVSPCGNIPFKQQTCGIRFYQAMSCQTRLPGTSRMSNLWIEETSAMLF